VVGWAGTTVAGGTMNLAETANTDGLSHVDVAGDGSGADVEPVNGLRWELLGWTGLDGINPTCEACEHSKHEKVRICFSDGEDAAHGHTWDWELSLSLQEGRVGLDELLRLQFNVVSASFRHQKSPDSLAPALSSTPSCPCMLIVCKSVRIVRASSLLLFPPLPRASDWTYLVTYINIANGNTTRHDCGNEIERGTWRVVVDVVVRLSSRRTASESNVRIRWGSAKWREGFENPTRNEMAAHYELLWPVYRPIYQAQISVSQHNTTLVMPVGGKRVIKVSISIGSMS
jgi:hypothetical protein